MLRVGLTGGIGCGKTTVSELFSELGVSIVDTDIIAHQIASPDGPAYQAIINLFGNEIVTADGTLNRKELAELVFQSKEKKKQLEDLLHPLIWIIVEQQVSSIKSPYVIIVVPLLFEGQHQTRFNSTLLVNCSEQEQVDRVKTRDHRNEVEIKSIINNQQSSDEKIPLADKVINNSSNLDKLKNEVSTLHQLYLEESANISN